MAAIVDGVLDDFTVPLETEWDSLQGLGVVQGTH
jgi:hypothetical protein